MTEGSVMADEYISRNEHNAFASDVDHEQTRQNKRIEALEVTVRQINDLTLSVQKLAINMISIHTPTKGATAILTNNFLIFCLISLIISILYLKIIQILFLFRYKHNFLSHISGANLLLFLCSLYTRISIKSVADQLVFLYLHQNVLP